MKTKSFFMIFLGLFLSTTLLPCQAFSLDLYDDFSGTNIDKSKWKWGEFVREIDTGSGKLLLKHGSDNPNTASSFPYTTWNYFPFSDPNSVNSIRADVTILQNQISGAAYTRTRLEGRWFNDGTAGGGYAGDIYAEIGTRWTGTEFKGYWYVGRYPGASDAINQLGYGLFTTTINIGANHNLRIDYDSGANEFLFMIGSESITFGTSSGLPARVKNANNPWKSLTTRVQIDNQNSSGYIVATFDNVYKNGALYDTFSSPTIDSAKWTRYEFVREISGGKLRSKVRSSSGYTSNVVNRLEFVDPSASNVIQAKVTPLSYQNSQSLDVQARIGGDFYQDGTSGGGYIGGVGASVWIGGNATNPGLVAGWYVWRYTDSAGNMPELLDSGAFATSISLGNAYTLFIGWDGSRLTFKCEGEVQTYTPATPINPFNKPWKEIATRIMSPAGEEATIEALFDDVMVEEPTIYDDFSGNYINKEMWTRGEWVREIDTGSQKLLSKLASPNPVVATTFPHTESNWLNFSDPNSVNSIRADVAILQNSIANYAYTRARIGGIWYNDGSPGGGMTGDIWTEVSLRGEPNRLFARWEVFKSTNPDGTTGTVLGSGNFTTPITLGVTHTLYISYDDINNRFTFRVGAEEFTFGPGGLPARVGNANMPYKQIGTRVQINGGGSSAYISATFDNVYKNGALYDNFSSPTINSTRWTNYEFVRENSGGKLRSKTRSSTESTSTISNRLEFISPSSINVIKAKVTPVSYQNDQGIDAVSAYAGGIYYNDGTPGGGFIGDVFAGVRIGGSGVNPVGGWRVARILDDSGNTETVAEGSFTTPITLGDTYSLFIRWDGSKFIFKINDEVAQYTPATTINPTNNIRRELGTSIRNPGGNEATIEALFDDVMVESRVLAGDSNGDGQTTIDEVQKCINQYLGISPVEPFNDQNGDGQVAINEVQQCINAFLGL